MLTCRRLALTLPALLVLLVAAATLVAQEAVPSRALGTREAEGAETFSQVRGFRELSDGRVLITDQRERKIVLLDLTRGTAMRVGREGPGPGEYQMAIDLVAMPGDTTLLGDVGRGLDILSVITPDGKISGSKRLPEGSRFSYLFGVDAAGRIHVAQTIFRTAGEPAPDSQPILRLDLRRNVADTAFFVRTIPRNPAAPNPYSPRHQWAIGRDGSAAIVDVEKYQVTWITTDGRRTTGAPIPFEPIAVTQADHDEFRELAIRLGGIGQSGMARVGGASGSASLPAPAFPSHKPPFLGNDATMIAPNGELWVRRSQRAREKAPRHDIIDRNGQRIATVTLPPNTKLLALGVHGIYLARYDEDDLIHIERYAYPR
jgi:hypothetical protein